MFAVVIYRVDITFESAVILVFCAVALFFLGGWMFYQEPNGRAISWEYLDPKKCYRILCPVAYWTPLVAMIQDEHGSDEPFLVYLPEDELLAFQKGVLIRKIMETGKYRLYVTMPKVIGRNSDM